MLTSNDIMIGCISFLFDDLFECQQILFCVLTTATPSNNIQPLSLVLFIYLLIIILH